MHLGINSNKLSTIFIKHDAIRSITCTNNNITSIDYLPERLRILVCSDNNITHICELPSMLRYLDCSHNKLEVLPELPLFLDYIDCSYLESVITCSGFSSGGFCCCGIRYDASGFCGDGVVFFILVWVFRC